jgi:hypothetical protein
VSGPDWNRQIRKLPVPSREICCKGQTLGKSSLAFEIGTPITSIQHTQVLSNSSPDFWRLPA